MDIMYTVIHWNSRMTEIASFVSIEELLDFFSEIPESNKVKIRFSL